MSDYDSTVFVLSWDMHGLESCINATQLDQERTFNVLRDADTGHDQLSATVAHMKLRAQFNPQRHYEIYSIAVDSSITEQDLIDQFESNPQDMANLIRSRGNKLYSNRMNKDSVKIT